MKKMTLSEFKNFIKTEAQKMLNEAGVSVNPNEIRPFLFTVTREFNRRRTYFLEDKELFEKWAMGEIKKRGLFPGFEEKAAVHLQLFLLGAKSEFDKMLQEYGMTDTKTKREELYKDVYYEIEMMMRPTDNSLSMDEISDIANNYGVTQEYVVGVMQTYLVKRAEERVKELADNVEYVRNEMYHKGNEDPTFEQFWDEYSTSSFDFDFDREEVRKEFVKQTTNPAQLSLFEAKMKMRAIIKDALSENFNHLKFSKGDKVAKKETGESGTIIEPITTHPSLAIAYSIRKDDGGHEYWYEKDLESLTLADIKDTLSEGTKNFKFSKGDQVKQKETGELGVIIGGMEILKGPNLIYFAKRDDGKHIYWYEKDLESLSLEETKKRKAKKLASEKKIPKEPKVEKAPKVEKTPDLVKAPKEPKVEKEPGQ